MTLRILILSLSKANAFYAKTDTSSTCSESFAIPTSASKMSQDSNSDMLCRDMMCSVATATSSSVISSNYRGMKKRVKEITQCTGSVSLRSTRQNSQTKSHSFAILVAKKLTQTSTSSHIIFVRCIAIVSRSGE